MKTVNFTEMKKGTKEEYLLLDEYEQDYINGTADRILKFMKGLTSTLEGYKITRLEHSLQAATRAFRDKADEEMIVAALLHDIGDELAPLNHSEYAAAVLKPYVSKKTHWIIEKHGEFQMYYYAHHLGKNKKIILIDDSLVRGTTSHKIVKMLYDAGAKEVHVKIACPEIKYPDFYGVDTPTKKELLAANKSNDEICQYIGAKTLKFLSLDGMYRAIGFETRNINYPQLTDHYFTGDYPVKPIDELGDSKITQLSLLNTASNN